MDEFLTLNVGGTLYTSTLSTLTKYPDTMLATMFSGRMLPSAQRDAQGHYLIDGDGTIFRYILNFLRRGILSLPDDFKDWDLLSAEGDFYQIEKLTEGVKQLKENRRQDSTCSEMEYIQIELGGNYYAGSLATFLQLPHLLQCWKDHSTPQNFDNLMRRLERSGEIDHGNITNFNRLEVFREASKIGFTLLTPSSISDKGNFRQRWLFGRNVTKMT